jgi:DNA-binding NarL/FixJ family response regulator
MSPSPYRTLLADDVFDLRFMVKLALERSGRFVVVAEAENGADAIKMAEQHQPDLVLLDVSMPVKDGLEALPDIRSAAPGAKVVMLSGFEAGRLAVTALDAGASAYLEKGIPPTELVTELLKVLEGDPAGAGSTNDDSATG